MSAHQHGATIAAILTPDRRRFVLERNKMFDFADVVTIEIVEGAFGHEVTIDREFVTDGFSQGRGQSVSLPADQRGLMILREAVKLLERRLG